MSIHNDSLRVGVLFCLAICCSVVEADDVPTKTSGSPSYRWDIKSLETYRGEEEVDAAYWLGFKYEHGHEVIPNEAEALSWYQVAAEGGHLPAMIELVDAYTSMLYRDDPEAYAQGIQWLEAAADADSVVAMRRLAEIYAWGSTFSQDLVDLTRAKRLLGQARELGGVQSVRMLANLTNQSAEDHQDEAAALALYEEAAELGDAASMLILARHYGYADKDNKARIDGPVALAWLERAADLGHDGAMSLLAEWYLRGHHVDVNIDKALFWLDRLIESSDSRIIRRAAMYRHGVVSHDLGGERDEQAIRYLRHAAKEGHAGAMELLGRIYDFGEGVDEDDALAYF
ncbi:MAG: SEL1-like repeat protein [Phycisphaeraceae bacterium]